MMSLPAWLLSSMFLPGGGGSLSRGLSVQGASVSRVILSRKGEGGVFVFTLFK